MDGRLNIPEVLYSIADIGLPVSFALYKSTDFYDPVGPLRELYRGSLLNMLLFNMKD